jgi:hypothetical protein
LDALDCLATRKYDLGSTNLLENLAVGAIPPICPLFSNGNSFSTFLLTSSMRGDHVNCFLPNRRCGPKFVLSDRGNLITSTARAHYPH